MAQLLTSGIIILWYELAFEMKVHNCNYTYCIN